MAAKRAMQEIIHATGTKYDCPMVITPIKSRKHPDMARHHVVHHVFDAVSVEGFIQSKETAEMAYSNNEMEHGSES